MSLRKLEVDHIFCHADEDVYSKLVHIIWKHDDLYEKVNNGWISLVTGSTTICGFRNNISIVS